MTIHRSLKKAPRRKDPYRTLPSSRALFQNVSDAMSDGMMIIDRQGQIVLVNPALGGMLGLEARDMLGRGWAELFFDGPAENNTFNDVVVEVIQQQVCHHNRQVTYYPPQGPSRELIITTDLLLDKRSRSRTVIGILAVFKDITEIKALHHREQELLEKSRRLYQEKLEGLNRLAEAVAHEIRNPVMSIGGLSMRLLGQCDPEGQQSHYLERIVASSRRLEQIVAQVSNYAGLKSPRPVRLELLSWLSGLARQYRERAQAQGVRLEGPRVQPGLEGLKALADPKLLGHLLGVLLENALEAMPRGGDLRLELARHADPGRVVISVSDTGQGIAPDDQPYIFDPFFTTKAAGIGMGLALAKRIAEEHDAVLSVESSPGQGATFRLSLPL